MATPEFTQTESPLHGFQGNRRPVPATGVEPRGLTIALSREAGSRGASIAARVGKALGWQAYHQELLDYIAHEGTVRDSILTGLQAAEVEWIEGRLRALDLPAAPPVLEQARLILALGMAGNVVLLGRGAGCLLPAASTLHVRIIAPLPDRIAYMSQWLRLTHEQAAEQVRLRDANRAEFIQNHYQRLPGDPYQYDLLINSSLLGEDLCVELIVRAAKAKQTVRERPPAGAPPWETEVVP